MDITLYPNAKLNFGLAIGPRQSDGFHPLSTIFLPLYGYCDELHIRELPGSPSILLLLSSGGDLGNEDDNLVVRAYRLLLPFDPPCVEVTLTKRIPVGAGLGGGSADAAFMLSHMATRCAKPVPQALLPQLALQLGSDVPFFLINRPCQATGRGERCQLLPSFPPFQWVLVATPSYRVNTAQAFATLDALRLAAEQGRVGESSKPPQYPIHPHNDFWPVLQHLYPPILHIYTALQALRPDQLSLSGSGSTLYALFQGPKPSLDFTFPDATVRLLPLGPTAEMDQ